MEYKNKKDRNRANKKGILCRYCSQKEVHSRPEFIAKFKIIGELRSKKYKGRNNPFYGRKHTEETKEKLRKIDRKNNPVYHSEEFKEKSKRVGKDNGMYGKNFYDVWVCRYGREVADKKMLDLKNKRSFNASGSKNPMYGKSSPKGSGGGWSGWYKGWYFRSLRELSYMINVIIKKHYKWESCEKKKFNIKYVDYKGDQRTYRPDFLLNDKIVIEVKPKKLMGTPNNIRKKEAAISFCKKNNLKYKMVDVEILEIKKIIQLYLNKKIKFVKKYEQRILDIISKQNKKEENNDAD